MTNLEELANKQVEADVILRTTIRGKLEFIEGEGWWIITGIKYADTKGQGIQEHRRGPFRPTDFASIKEA